jgi:DNA repair photolyase
MSGEAEYRDALPTGVTRGRGAGLNPGNRFEDVRLHVLGEHLDEVIAENPDGTRVTTRVYADRTKTIINHVESPDIGFDWTINPYRGCEHGCIYCYARPGHETLGWSLGLDFETKIMAKLDAATLLRKELRAPKWKGEKIVMSGVTDPYQPIEAKLRITRSVLEVLAECRQPVSFITKNKLILRDLDLLRELHAHRAVSVAVSITSLDNDLARRMEPRASAPADRLKTVETLATAGIPVSVMTAPIIPGLNDNEIPALLKAASEAGATGAGYVMLRLPYQIKDLFLDWLKREFPERAGRVENAVREMRGGALYDARPFVRGRGEGVRAEQIAATFKLFKRRYGLDQPRGALSSASFRRPEPLDENPHQLGLFAANEPSARAEEV